MAHGSRFVFAVTAVALASVLGGASSASVGLFDWWDARVFGTGHDAITTPGHPVALTAKFERQLVSYLRPDVRGERVRFAFAGGAATARTDRDGVAALAVQAGAPGVVPFEAALAGNRQAQPAQARLFVYDPQRPVVVIDLDGTLSDLPDWEVPLHGDVAPTFPHALALVRDLARTHAIVYLTARDDALDAMSRGFLARHGYPDGPVLYNDWGLTSRDELEQLRSKNHGAFKLEVIRALQARGVNVTLGIGNAETDAYAYEQAGIESFIHTTQVGSGPSFRFTSYADLRLELVARGVLP